MTIVNIDDLREAARRRLPKLFYDYIDGGSFAETTLQANRSDFGRYRLEQRVLTGMAAEPDLSTSFLGGRHALPFMPGPVGFLGLYRGGGEILAARAAHRAGVPFCLSTFSIAGLGTLARRTQGELHFQLYILTDRTLMDELLQAATEAGVGTLYLTVDTAITAVREKDVRNGFRSATRPTPRMLAGMARRPGWCLDVLKAGWPAVEAVTHRPDFGRGALEHAANLSRRIDKSLTWRDVAGLRARWPGRLVIKGVLSAQDAVQARDCGADGVVVSNHGGRQLDGASSTIAVLEEVRAAVGPDFDVLIDGGFRRGSDIACALALGASGILLGRAVAFGLAAGGEEGAFRALDILRTELSLTLALMGLPSVDALKAAGASAIRRA